MKHFESSVHKIPVWAMLGVATLVGIVILSVLLFGDLADAKMIGIVSGLLTGLVMFLVTMITQVYLFGEIDRYRTIGVIDLLSNRHDRSYYGPLLSGAKKSVRVTGASATRFLDDFMNSSDDEHLLLDAMRQRPDLTVQVLIPADRRMDNASRTKWKNIAPLVDSLQNEFGPRFEIRRFDEPATQSFVVVDEDAHFVGGPILEGASKYAPAVHVKGWTAFAKKHVEYFEALWGRS